MSTESLSKERGAIRGLGNALLKGALTKNNKKLVTHLLCTATAEAAKKIPENDEKTKLHARILKALVKNSDVHAYCLGQLVNKKPKTGDISNAEEQEPEGHKKLLLEEERLHATLEKLQSELIVPQDTLTQAQKAVDDNQAKIDKYAKKGGYKSWEKKSITKQRAIKKLLIEMLRRRMSIVLKMKLQK